MRACVCLCVCVCVRACVRNSSTGVGTVPHLLSCLNEHIAAKDVGQAGALCCVPYAQNLRRPVA